MNANWRARDGMSGCGLRVASCELRVASCELRVADVRVGMGELGWVREGQTCAVLDLEATAVDDQDEPKLPAVTQRSARGTQHYFFCWGAVLMP